MHIHSYMYIRTELYTYIPQNKYFAQNILKSLDSSLLLSILAYLGNLGKLADETTPLGWKYRLKF